MTKSKIGIVGFGTVGYAVHVFWHGHHINIYDPVVKPNGTKEGINECDVAFVCVSTPSLPDGRCDTSIVEEVVDWLTCPLIVIKSTVEPGTTAKLIARYPEKHIVFSPEFIGQGSYHSPFKLQKAMVESDYYIFGGCSEDTSAAVDLYLLVAGPNKRYIQCHPTAAEMSKYVTNSYFATKILFCYEMASICKAAGIDWNVVRELWLLDPRVEQSHTAVFAGQEQPFGGACFPKDTAALVAWAQSINAYSPQLSRTITTNRAWCNRPRQITEGGS